MTPLKLIVYLFTSKLKFTCLQSQWWENRFPVTKTRVNSGIRVTREWRFAFCTSLRANSKVASLSMGMGLNMALRAPSSMNWMMLSVMMTEFQDSRLNDSCPRVLINTNSCLNFAIIVINHFLAKTSDIRKLWNEQKRK